MRPGRPSHPGTRLVVVKLPSHVQLFVTPWTALRQASLALTVSRSLPKFMSMALVMLPCHLILCRPLLRGERDECREMQLLVGEEALPWGPVSMPLQFEAHFYRHRSCRTLNMLSAVQ